MSQALFISDLHLSEKTPNLVTLFFDFLKTHLIDFNTQLYIIGDFFEYWIGEDTMDPLQRSVLAELKQYSDQGYSIYWMPGNRDFLIGKELCHAYGLHFLPDPSLIRVANKNMMIAHGDFFCQQEQGYQRYRRLVRTRWIQRCFLAMPHRFRTKVANQMRLQSSQKHATYTEPQKSDIDDAFFLEWIADKGAQFCIHGHTHRPRISLYYHAPQPILRIVLSDWQDNGATYCHIAANGDYGLHRYVTSLGRIAPQA